MYHRGSVRLNPAALAVQVRTSIRSNGDATPGAVQATIGGGVCDYFGGPCGDAFVAKITAVVTP